ncbi:hypothetical protein MICRO80W_180149 [Micrococcus luteus]|nr:hypothetical protein MICRO80W_180149 [Micrococcus luteus]
MGARLLPRLPERQGGLRQGDLEHRELGRRAGPLRGRPRRRLRPDPPGLIHTAHRGADVVAPRRQRPDAGRGSALRPCPHTHRHGPRNENRREGPP